MIETDEKTMTVSELIACLHMNGHTLEVWVADRTYGLMPVQAVEFRTRHTRDNTGRPRVVIITP